MTRLLTSYRFALAALGALLAALIGGAVAAPDGSPAPLRILYVVLTAVVASSMAACTWKRVLREFRAVRESRAGGASRPIPVAQRLDFRIPLPSAMVAGGLDGILARAGWGKGRRASDGSLVYERGRAGVWGSIVFHLGMLAIIAAIGLSTGYGVRGMFALTEGEAFTGGAGAMRNVEIGMLADTSSAGSLSVSMLRFNRRHQVAGATAPAAELRILEDTTEVAAVVYANNGYASGPGTLHYAEKWGFSPAIVIEDTAGNIVFAGLVRLATQIQDGTARFLDQIDIGGGRSLQAEFFPDLRMSGGKAGTKGTELKNPYILLTLSDSGTVAATGLVGLNQSITSKGFVLVFPEVRHWAQFEFVRDPGVGLLYAGFLISLAGLAVRMLFVRKKLAVTALASPGGTVITFAGWSEKYRHSLEEDLRALSERVVKELTPAQSAEREDDGAPVVCTPQECC